MEFLQAAPVPKDMIGLLFGIVCVLAGAIVTLALYIRKMHNKHTDQVLKNTNEVTLVCTGVKGALDNTVKATDNLSNMIVDLHKTILQSTGK